MRSFDFTLSLTSARLPSFGGRVVLLARAHGFLVKAGVDVQRHARGSRSIFAAEEGLFEEPLTDLDVPPYFALLDAFVDLKGGEVDLEGITDTSDNGHVATLQGALDEVAFRASVGFLSSGFTGRDATPLAALARHLLEGTQIEEPLLTEGASLEGTVP